MKVDADYRYDPYAPYTLQDSGLHTNQYTTSAIPAYDMEKAIPSRRRKGMAVASFIISIISVPTLGLLLVGAIISIILGSVAAKKARINPAQYGGRGLAIAGIVMSVLSLIMVPFIGIIAAITIPNVVKAQQQSRETYALSEVQAIGKAQLLYSINKGRGKYTDLKTLAAEGFIDSSLASGEKNGYVFRSTPINDNNLPPMYDTVAVPVAIGAFGTGNRSYYSNETMVVYEAEGSEAPKASPYKRVPDKGNPVGGQSPPANLNRGQGPTATLTSTDGTMKINLPQGWKENRTMHEKAELQLVDASNDLYVIVLSENKVDLDGSSIGGYSERTRGVFIKSLNTAQVIGSPVWLTINGNKALQYEMRGAKDGVNAVFLHTIVETPKKYYQIVGWTLPSLYERNRSKLQAVIQSFTEVGADVARSGS